MKQANTPLRRTNLEILRASTLDLAECYFGGRVLDGKTMCHSGFVSL